MKYRGEMAIMILLIVLTFVIVYNGKSNMEGMNECASACMNRELSFHSYEDRACYCEGKIRRIYKDGN